MGGCVFLNELLYSPEIVFDSMNGKKMKRSGVTSTMGLKSLTSTALTGNPTSLRVNKDAQCQC